MRITKFNGNNMHWQRSLKCGSHWHQPEASIQFGYHYLQSVSNVNCIRLMVQGWIRWPGKEWVFLWNIEHWARYWYDSTECTYKLVIYNSVCMHAIMLLLELLRIKITTFCAMIVTFWPIRLLYYRRCVCLIDRHIYLWGYGNFTWSCLLAWLQHLSNASSSERCRDIKDCYSV
jgi:hypothetical protein